jgi:hypothetical protein
MNVSQHHIHADPATGDIGDPIGRGKTGSEDQLPDLFVAHGLRDRQSVLSGLVQDFVPIQSGAVIDHLHHDPPSLLYGLAGDNTAW